ncbi:uncharacterized protein LOC118436871 [Folsomia candida]|uniref:F-box domain-containing protein n=1 Tax=Folsomia candida TaxID=158441 RepID=A0A226DWB4_FOLCA|nr:uncharacterized protein LOC118436871 [Folsomia candida]OXA49533.1 hypothetical protein Fcan01_15450 [Folsomia candida]
MDVELSFLGWYSKLKTRGQLVYCVLPYIEGQQYTFGHSYEGCVDGEEFLFLFRIQSFEEVVSSARFQISCRHGNYWIKRLSTGQDYAIFLNKTEVCDSTDGMKMTLGDMLVIEDTCGGPDPPPPWWKFSRWKVFSKGNKKRSYQYKNSWRFQERTIYTPFDPSGDHALEMIEYFPRDTTESYLALDNTLILSKIFSHLGLSTLKNCRLVSSLWESEAVPWLKSRSEIRFKLYPYSELTNSPPRLFLYRHEMLPFAHPNWHVECFDDGKNLTFPKLSHDLDQILENCHVIRRLSCVHYPSMNNVLLIGLLNRLAGSLEELAICFETCENVGEDITELFQVIEFPLLKRFEIDMGPNVVSTIRPEWYESLTGSMIRLSRRVSAMYLKSESAPMNANFLREIVSNRESYPRLREVRVRKIDRDGMEVLRGLRAGLVRLEINWFSDECEIRQVEGVVQGQRNSLEFLRLEVPPGWGVVPVGEMPYLKRKQILFREV